MNILLLCDEYPPGRHGGIGTAVRLLATQFTQMGHSVVVAGFCHRGYGGADEYDDNGVKVYRFRQHLASSFFAAQDNILVRAVTRLLDISGILAWDVKTSLRKYKLFLNEIIDRHKIQIVEMADYHDYMRFCKEPQYFPTLNVPVVVKLHGSMTYFNEEAGLTTPDYIRQMERAILNNAAAVVSVSKYTAIKTAKYFSYSKEISVLYNGIDMPEISKNVKKTKGSVIFTGSLVEKKGIYQLMKAWNIVIEKVPHAILHVYGKGPIEKIEALLEKDKRSTVVFKGHVGREELYDSLSKAEAAVFPSYAETFGLGPVEAMACGTAVVFSVLTSGPEIVQDEKTGLLVHPDDVMALAEAIIKLLSNETYNQMLVKNGKQFVNEHFNIVTVAKQHIDYYKSLLSENAGI